MVIKATLDELLEKQLGDELKKHRFVFNNDNDINIIILLNKIQSKKYNNKDKNSMMSKALYLLKNG